MGFLLCLVLRKSQLNLLLWRKLLWFGERLGWLLPGCWWCAWGPAQALCVPVCHLALSAGVAGCDSCTSGPKLHTCPEELGQHGHKWNVTWCQLVFPGISLCYKQFSWNPVSQFPDDLWKAALCLLKVSIHAGGREDPRKSGQFWAHIPGSWTGVIPCLVLP